MTNIALLLAAASTLISLICFAALIEMYKNLQELQKYVDYDDAPKPLPEVTSAIVGRNPSEFGLPAAFDAANGVMLLLSPRCHTCSRVGQKLAEGIPLGLTVIVSGADEETATQWLEEIGMTSRGILFDGDRKIVDSLALYTTPSVVRFHEGTILGAWSVASHRALQTVLAQEPPNLATSGPAVMETLEAQGGEHYAAAG